MELLVTFQTDNERVHVLAALRKCEFPQNFPLKHPQEVKLSYSNQIKNSIHILYIKVVFRLILYIEIEPTNYLLTY